MPAIIETTELISRTMDEIIDFVVSDEFLGQEFENYLTKNKIEIKKETELNDILISYLLDGKISDGIRVLDYFLSKKDADKKTVNALYNSFVSVFRIEKVLKNCYETKCLISEKSFTLTPLVKTTNLRGIGLYDFIKARVVEIENNFYVLEIFDVFSAYREHFAHIEVVKSVLKNPKSAIQHNPKKFLEIKNSIKSFHSSFVECFSKEEIIVSSKDVDEILNNFYLFHTGKIEKFDYSEIKEDFNLEFFEIEDFRDDFLINAKNSFSSNGKEYDVGIYSNLELGIFVLPFLKTFNVKNDNNCIKHFLLDDKVPPQIIQEKAKTFDITGFASEIANKNFNSTDEVIDYFKYDYKDGFRLSSINILYNLESFSKILGYKEEKENKTIGRNDPCPCGSGKKYKKCCLK